MCVCSSLAAQSAWRDMTRRYRGPRGGPELQRLPAYIPQGGTNLSPQVSLDWPGSESSTVQSREDEEGRGRQGGRGRVGKHCVNASSLSLSFALLLTQTSQRRTPRTDHEARQRGEERDWKPKRSRPSARRPEATKRKGGWTAWP